MLASLVPSRGDLFGGISAGIVALPLCLAFGAISGLGPEAYAFPMAFSPKQKSDFDAAVKAHGKPRRARKQPCTRHCETCSQRCSGIQRPAS